MNEKIWWYLARSTGIVAWALLTASVLWGLLFTTKLLSGRPAPRWLLDLHGFLGALAVSFTGLHLVTLLGVSSVPFGVEELLIPFASRWRPGPVAAGVFALYLLVAVQASSVAMKRLPRRAWRAIHLTAFACFWAATLHGVTAGTSSDNLAMWVAYLAAATSVVFLTMFRVLAERRRRSGASPGPARVLTPALPPPATPNPAGLTGSG